MLEYERGAGKGEGMAKEGRKEGGKEAKDEEGHEETWNRFLRLVHAVPLLMGRHICSVRHLGILVFATSNYEYIRFLKHKEGILQVSMKTF